MKKKGQAFSIQTIVIAALALVVLIVLLFIFSGQATIFVQTIEKCEARNGTPVKTRAECSDNGGIVVFSVEGEPKEYCCVYGG